MSLYRPVNWKDGVALRVKIWHYDFEFKGKRYRGSTHSKDRRLAEIIEADVRNHVWAKWSGLKPWDLVCSVCGGDLPMDRMGKQRACGDECAEVLVEIEQIEQFEREAECLRKAKGRLRQLRILLSQPNQTENRVVSRLHSQASGQAAISRIS